MWAKAMGGRGAALWRVAALLAVAAAVTTAYTVDCNHEYADCDTELSKIANDEEEVPSTTSSQTLETLPPISTPTPRIIEVTENVTEAELTKEAEVTTEVQEAIEPKPQPRLLNLNVDELQNFANALHNQTIEKSSKKGLDLSDVNLDEEDDEVPRIHDHKNKNIPDKFYSNLQAPFHHLLNNERGSDEIGTCKENEISYKIGDHMDRGCEESCECTPGGVFECSPRCKHPYIRSGRRLNDPLCFESPVDSCCSIIACSTGNGDTKPMKLDVCRYGNDTYPVGTKWNIGCEQSCMCEPNSVATCKPRCKQYSPSEKCINVQDPNDACCEIQVCDVSQDVHEEPPDNVTSSTTSASETARSFDMSEELKSTSRPLVLAEPIGSVKVLNNNSVQVNLIHVNTTEDPVHLLLSDDGGKTYQDVELKYSNLILNLDGGKDYILKTKETGTKFNFTITTTAFAENEVKVGAEDMRNDTKEGCYENGKFYEIGEEFHIGCSELCECTGPDKRECAALVCPSHVGLELMSKGCVRWAPSPPAVPPNCCPRSARCLSDGTCHYKGVAVPNWSEVPLDLTGCEQRCFCENGELDCQEVCSPLPAVPPQNFRCPPLHRPAPVNISDEDCCKEWGCVPNAESVGTTKQSHSMPTFIGPDQNYVTRISPSSPTLSPILPTPPLTTDPIDFYRHLSPVKSFPKVLKTFNPIPLTSSVPKYYVTPSNYVPNDNITVFTLDDMESPLKIIHADTPFVTSNVDWKLSPPEPNKFELLDPITKSTYHAKSYQKSPLYKDKPHFIVSDDKFHNLLQSTGTESKDIHFYPDSLNLDYHVHEPVKKVPISQLPNLDLFLPNHDHSKGPTKIPLTIHSYNSEQNKIFSHPKQATPSYFEPTRVNISSTYSANSNPPFLFNTKTDASLRNTRKHVTMLKTKDIHTLKPNNNVLTKGLWTPDQNTHLLTKSPNPYETVLLRAVPNVKMDTKSTLTGNEKISQPLGKKYTSLDLEHLLGQMEVESEVNRNLGRSADKSQDIAAGEAPPPPPGFPQQDSRPQQPSFLPTIPPEIHFPQEDIPDYDQNNIHRPSNPLEPGIPGLPPGFSMPTNYGEVNKKLSVISLQADSPNSVKMMFGLPPVLVGLRGSVDLRYTDKVDEDVSQWSSQVFAPADEVLTTPRLEFRLTGLKPSTTYKIRAKLYLHNLPVEPKSEVYTVRTQDAPTIETPVEEKRKEIDSKLTVLEVNDTTAQLNWRRFSEEELQYIDGIQVRYRPVGTPIYSMTELLHHSRPAVELHELRPGTPYEASLVLIPPPRSNTELIDPGRVEFTTAPYTDPYNWSVTVEALSVGAGAVQVSWRGVPAPAERWVRVYRAAHSCGRRAAGGARAAGREHDAFTLAARDAPTTLTLSGLEPDSRCRVWLELFLTNGKVKTSNVLEINTRPADEPEDVDNEIEASSVSGSRSAERGDYYGGLVVAGVLAALGALTSLLLLLVVVRRHRPRSVPITPVPTAPRESSLPPYDNPAYKLELQQETMDL
uniref:Fibronectin type-III domain-containing protein n=1 Tax=Bombyx mori TaxID=7091 RepID=A0A8R2R8G1_BOMMO|nr:putative epidermal cell surface receptor isoform X1 [Bombyx mori]